MDLRLFTGRANPNLGRRIAETLDIPLGNITIDDFPDGEIFVKYEENIRGKDVFVIQSTCSPPNRNLVELLIMLDAARRASAGRLTAVIPFFGYARQDRKDQPRVPITAKLVANILRSAGAQRILTMDLHTQQIQGFFDIPFDHLYASPVIVKYLKEILSPGPVVVSPDSGSVRMAQAYANMLNGEFAVVAKRRLNADKVVTSHLVGDVKGRDCVLVDDLTTTAGTLVAAAERLRESGAKKIFAAVSHCCLTEKGHRRLQNSVISKLIVTDTVPASAIAPPPTEAKLHRLSVAGLLGKAIWRIHKGESVSTLFRLDQNAD